MDRFDLASKVFQTAPKPAGSFGVIGKSRHSDKVPPTHHQRLRHATQGVADLGVRHFSTINSIPHRLERSQKKKIPLPSPRTQETAATRSRSTSSRLAFGNATPEHVLDAASQMFVRQHSRGPRVSRIRCGGICLQF